MIIFGYTQFIAHLAMLVFLTVASCGFVFCGAMFFKWLVRKRK